MDLVHALAEKYADQYTSPDDSLLAQIQAETIAHHPHAHMLSSPVQGKFLQFISTILAPKYVLEIGTFTGYSAICLAKGLVKGGELHTIELREEDAKTSSANFSKSEFAEQINLHTGNAKEIIPAIDRQWDLVFIDADKTGYADYYDLILPRLSERGLIIADNVLFHGQVLEEQISGKNALAIDRFNKKIAEDNRVEQVLLTVRDGLLLIKKR